MEEQRLLAYGQMIGELWLEWCDNSTSTLNKQILMGETEDKSEGISDIVDFTQQRLGFDPNPLQQLVLRGRRRGIVNCTRQSRLASETSEVHAMATLSDFEKLLPTLSPGEKARS